MKPTNLLSYPFSLAIVVVMLTILSGCASTQKEIDTATEFSGYLGDYSQLKEVDDDRYLWISETLQKGKYKKIILKPVSTYPHDLLKDHENAALIQQTAKELDKAFTASISKEFEIVSEPGPDVLLIRSAITENETYTQGMTGWEVIPVGAIIGGVMAVAGTRSRIVQLVYELEALDSTTNNRVAAVVRKGTATQDDRKKLTQEDFMIIVNEFGATSGENLAKVLK